MTADRRPLLRRLHALGRRAGLDHADLRRLAGVTSLSTATPDQLAEACRRIDPQRPPWLDLPPEVSARRAARRAPGPRLASDATERQRNAILALLARLRAAGLVRDPDAYLFRLARLRIPELARGDYLPRRTAARVIRDLMSAADELARQPRPSVQESAHD